MSESGVWDDVARANLREAISSYVLGHIRFAKLTHDEIVNACQEGFIDEECPENERDGFAQFASEEVKKVATAHEQSQADWPKVTDCDRLDRVEAELRDIGIVLWQGSNCCDTCTNAEMPDRVDVIDSRHPGLWEKLRGFAFYIDQTMEEMLAEDTQISIYLGYGSCTDEKSDRVYKKKALSIADEICDCLRKHGFKVDWNRNFSKKIEVPRNWQRRTPLQ